MREKKRPEELEELMAKMRLKNAQAEEKRMKVEREEAAADEERKGDMQRLRDYREAQTREEMEKKEVEVKRNERSAAVSLSREGVSAEE